MIAFQSCTTLLAGSSFMQSVPLAASASPRLRPIPPKWTMRSRLPFNEKFRRPSRLPSDYSLPSRSASMSEQEDVNSGNKTKSDEKVSSVGNSQSFGNSKTTDSLKSSNRNRSVESPKSVGSPRSVETPRRVGNSESVGSPRSIGSPRSDASSESVTSPKSVTSPESVASSESVESLKSVESSENVESTKNSESSESVESSKNAESSESVGNFQSVESSESIDNSKDIRNIKSVDSDKGTKNVVSERTSEPHQGTDGEPADQTLSSVGRVDLVGSKLENDSIKNIDDAGGDGNDSGGNDGGEGNNRGDDEDDEDGGDDDREELARSLRLTEAEGKEATLAELRNLQAASKAPLVGSLALNWPPLRNRLAANRRLYLQLGVEITVGCVTKTLAELQGRGERFWKEFDFYLSDMALEIFGDALLVWLLSPVVPWRTGGIALLENLPRHAGQIGAFSLPRRIGGYLYKGAQFGVAGFLSSVAGHGLTRWLVAIRDKKEGPEKHLKDGVELAPILPTSLAWGSFMMVSSNTRYQAVNGIEQRLLEPLFGANGALLTALTFALRFGNCYVGGLHWLPWAKMWDLQ